VPILTQPWKRLVEEGLIKSIAVDFTPTGTSVVGKAGRALVEAEGSGLNETDAFPLGKLLAVAERGNMIPKPGKKAKGTGAAAAPPKPAKSLVKSDLSAEGAPGLQTRVNMIASACGGGPLTGRVRSAGRFAGTETTSYQTWWNAADGDLRALSLAVGKNYSSFTTEEKNRLLGLQCPFRGTLEFKVAEYDQEEEEEEHEAPSPRPPGQPAAATAGTEQN
jgi:hypothetical protein